MANEYDYPVYDAGGRVEMYKEGGKVKEDKRLKDYRELRQMAWTKKLIHVLKKLWLKLRRKKRKL